MSDLSLQIYKFAQVFSNSHTREIEEIFSNNEIETKNSRYILKWDFIYRDIYSIAQANDLISPVLDRGALWQARGVIIEKVLYVFLMHDRFKALTENYEKNHYLTCIARSKNSHLNGIDKNILSVELFNDLDDDEVSKSQVVDAKKMLGKNYALIDEVQVVTFNRNTQEVSVNRVNAFCELIDTTNITEFDYTKLEEDGRENNLEKPLVALKSGVQRQLESQKYVSLPDEQWEEIGE